MEMLKKRFTEVVGDCEFGGCKSPTQKQYYLKRVADNLVTPMLVKHKIEYSSGSGNELNGKMKSLRSSSAMTFNILGNSHVRISENKLLSSEDFSITYEYQLPTLAGNPNPANLDTRLLSQNGHTVIYCEMKFAEWVFNSASDLRPDYLDPTQYLIPPEDAAIFIKALRDLISDEASKSESLKPKLSRYDAFQMVKHALAIYSALHKQWLSDNPVPEKITLLNCVWEKTIPGSLGKFEDKYNAMLEEEHLQFRHFHSAIEPIRLLFEKLGCSFSVEYLSALDFASLLELAPEHRAYLDRYVI